MIVPKGRIENVPLRDADEQGQPSAGHVFLRGDFLEATDTLVMVKVPVARLAKDEDGAISPILFDIARTTEQDTMDLSKKAIAVIPGMAGINRFQPVQQQTLWSFERMTEAKMQAERPYRVAIDVKLLVKITEAFGQSKVLLEFTGEPHDPILVLPAMKDDQDGREAILMPVASNMAPAKPKTDAEVEAEAAKEGT